MAECGTPYLDCVNKPESPESIFKRLISVDAEGNLSLNICGCECGGTGGGIVSVTYEELVALIGSSGLTAGGLYKITDYKTVHYLLDYNYSDWTTYNLGIIFEGNLEPLIVLALTENEISNIAFSEDYPQDIIHYDWDPTLWMNDSSFSDKLEGVPATHIIPGFKGVIYYREDTQQNNILSFDFRNCKFRRYALDVPDYNSLTSYNEYDYVESGNKIWVSYKNANQNHTPAADSLYWVQVFDLSHTKYWSASKEGYSFENYMIPVDDEDYQDQTIFGVNYENRVFDNKIITSKYRITTSSAWLMSILPDMVFYVGTGSKVINNTMVIDTYQFTWYGTTFGYNQIRNTLEFVSIDCDYFISNNFDWIFSTVISGTNFYYNNISKLEYSFLSGAMQTNNFGIINYSFLTTVLNVCNIESLTYCKIRTMLNMIGSTVNLCDFSAGTHVANTTSKIIHINSSAVNVISYIDGSNVQQIVAATS